MSPSDHVRALEDAGFADAAAELRRLKMEESETDESAEVTRPPAMTGEQAAREQEGAALLAALHRGVPSLRPDAEPTR